MFHILLYSIFSLTITMFLSGCFSNNINLAKYPVNKLQKLPVSESCKIHYKTKLPNVAVVPFSNHSDFKTENSSLENGLISPLEDMIILSKGATVIARNDLEKINNELKLQDSGLLEQNTLVEFGKLSGAEYLITGSLDFVEQNYRNNARIAMMANQLTSFSKNEKVQIGGLLGLLGSVITDGLTLHTKITIKVIHISSGKILFSKQLEASRFIGKIRYASDEQIIEGIKATMNDTLPQIQNDLIKLFNPIGYITKILAEDNSFKSTILQINLGTNHNIKKDDTFEVYTLDTVTDPITSQEFCEQRKLPVSLKASDLITDNFTWTKLNGEGNLLQIGQIIKKTLE